jgi:predicted PhzF superfamily epimerase YddE/YHI9
VHHQILSASDGIVTFRGKQGEAIGRPGIVTVSVDVRERQPVEVQVGGNATIVFKTEIVI